MHAHDDTHGHWDPFGHPLFNDPKARALSRVGVVDIGSNSVRLVVFDGAARSPAYFFNEKILCGLGAGMAETGRLNPQGRERALRAMKRFKLLAEGMDLPAVTVVATAAMRDAEDGPEFRKLLEKETGLKVHVIDGTEEARLSAQGVLLGWPASYGLVCDIGGSSMELAEIQKGEIGRRITSPLGPLKLQGLGDDPKARAKHIAKEMQKLADHMGTQRDRLFLVGGSWRAIAKIDMERRDYPLHVLHEYRMDAKSVADTIAFIKDQDPEALRKSCGISSTRMALVPIAAEVLSELCATFQPKDIAISSYGIREGLLFEQMPQDLRDRDPLIEACRFAEAKDARLPGFGSALYHFVMPLFPDALPTMRRLIKAACLLHDVSWRAHPDYRAETCFDNATRANLGGLKHWERVFLGLALLHRYRNKREGTRFEHLYDLLDLIHQQEAEILGKAMRLGAMLWTLEAEEAEVRLEWDREASTLRLHLSEATEALFGEVAESRFKSLAQSLGAENFESVTG
ncbi:Ppx/GppA family phosphatase [Tropicibacter naphthalenivorans]|uniref:Guanosine-5'-triphosphate,3'-diphosphate pyrophosphatase n=1 Tax=Tropicibacter naphthalenivorans TaxID=441103 RepID=A0A0P1G3Y7_9RHOB|nr:Ppx/GppA family phosphatase [Tropicibacter naphthalenivorans]CUH76549.1 Guanosine-5'-triphosphate,3'-diphosphate pyrophosphatase [Tropicibacter naphthalenivorans]SMC65438.1 exopolyphosphatase / guanosine-5'-triphosphate,3'-diphosphate pyrophosphatase [Tropicibacter naphthalenivorans]